MESDNTWLVFIPGFLSAVAAVLVRVLFGFNNSHNTSGFLPTALLAICGVIAVHFHVVLSGGILLVAGLVGAFAVYRCRQSGALRLPFEGIAADKGEVHGSWGEIILFLAIPVLAFMAAIIALTLLPAALH